LGWGIWEPGIYVVEGYFFELEYLGCYKLESINFKIFQGICPIVRFKESTSFCSSTFTRFISSYRSGRPVWSKSELVTYCCSFYRS